MGWQRILQIVIVAGCFSQSASVAADATQTSGNNSAVKTPSLSAPKLTPKQIAPGAVVATPTGQPRTIRTRPFTLAGTGRTIDPRGGVEFVPITKRLLPFTLAGTGSATTIDRSSFTPKSIRTRTFTLAGSVPATNTLKPMNKFKPVPLSPAPKKP